MTSIEDCNVIECALLELLGGASGASAAPALTRGIAEITLANRALLVVRIRRAGSLACPAEAGASTPHRPGLSSTERLP